MLLFPTPVTSPSTLHQSEQCEYSVWKTEVNTRAITIYRRMMPQSMRNTTFLVMWFSFRCSVRSKESTQQSLWVSSNMRYSKILWLVKVFKILFAIKIKTVDWNWTRSRVCCYARIFNIVFALFFWSLCPLASYIQFLKTHSVLKLNQYKRFMQMHMVFFLGDLVKVSIIV